MEKNQSTYLDDDDSVFHLDIHLKRFACINEHEHLSEQIERKRKRVLHGKKKNDWTMI